MHTFFTSDLHFGHTNIISYCGRPFKDRDDMDHRLIQQWNGVVSPADEVYVLGDVSFRSPKDTHEIVSSLNGKKYWVRGNHDHKGTVKLCGGLFEWVRDYAVVNVGGTPFALMHYPLEVWITSRQNGYHLHGHCHGQGNTAVGRMDVGVDCHPLYRPFNFDEVREYCEYTVRRGFSPRHPRNFFSACRGMESLER